MDLFVTIPEDGGKLTKCFFFWKFIDNCFLDERVRDWPLMKSVFPTVTIVILYLLFVIMGQRWMRDKKALELRRFMFVYNIFQVIFCTYITYEVRSYVFDFQKIEIIVI